jgi:hypothetical protein
VTPAGRRCCRWAMFPESLKLFYRDLKVCLMANSSLEIQINLPSVGFELNMRKTFTTMVYDQQRINYASAFCKALQTNEPFGQLISGPDGVGKTSVCLVSFFSCFARRLPTIYIPKGVVWSENSRNEEEAKFFLARLFFEQNADLIEKSDQLRPYFEDQLAGEAISEHSFDNWVSAIKEHRAPKCGLIVDDVHKIAEASVSAPRRSGNGAVVRDNSGDVLMKQFFSENFLNWQGDTLGAFSTMFCSSPYGLGSFPLQEDEEARLKFIQPFSKEDTKVLLSTRGMSPFYKTKLVDIAESVLQSMNGLAADLAYLNAHIDPGRNADDLRTSLGRIEGELIKSKYQRAKKKWFGYIPRYFQREALSNVMNLIRGDLVVRDRKDIYCDNGHALRQSTNQSASAVSPLAASALHSVFAEEYVSFAPHILAPDISDDERSKSFKLQVEARIHSPLWKKFITGRSYSTYSSVDVDFKADLCYCAESIDDIDRNRIFSTLWIPGRDRCLPFDGVIMPSIRSGSSAIMYCADVSDPFDAHRIEIVRAMESAKKSLLRRFPDIPDIVLLSLWHLNRDRSMTMKIAASDDSIDKNIEAYIVDQEELLKLKIAVLRPLLREKKKFVTDKSRFLSSRGRTKRNTVFKYR